MCVLNRFISRMIRPPLIASKGSRGPGFQGPGVDNHADNNLVSCDIFLAYQERIDYSTHGFVSSYVLYIVLLTGFEQSVISNEQNERQQYKHKATQ